MGYGRAMSKRGWIILIVVVIAVLVALPFLIQSGS